VPIRHDVEMPSVTNPRNPNRLPCPDVLSTQLELISNSNSSHMTQLDSLKRDKPAQVIISGASQYNQYSTVRLLDQKNNQTVIQRITPTLIEKRKRSDFIKMNTSFGKSTRIHRKN
jgi:hypothetical protein